MLLHQLIATREIHRVPQRRSTARTNHLYSLGELVQIAGEILSEVPDFVKRKHKGAIASSLDEGARLEQDTARQETEILRIVEQRMAG